MTALATEKPVLVTGAGGWLSSHIIRQLLDKGYKVRGTVRDLKGEKYTFLMTKEFHPRAQELLTLVEADLLKSDSWQAAIEGCEYVMHVASPFTFKYKDQMKDLVEPAVAGVENVLTACCKTETPVKRIVVTSSVCSVVFGHSKERYECSKAVVEMAKAVFNEQCASHRYSVEPCKENAPTTKTDTETSCDKATDAPEPADPYLHLRTSMAVPKEWASWKLMTPADWSIPENMQGYELSKVLAEKKAWDVITEHNSRGGTKIEMVAMCPGFIFGPLLAAAHGAGESSAHVLRLLNRTYPFVPAINSSHVDVRDAAACHLLAMEKPGIEGRRFLVTADDGNINFAEQAELLHRSMAKFGFNIPLSKAPRLITQVAGLFSTSIATAASKLDNITYTTNVETHSDLGMKEWRTTEGALYSHAMSLVKYGLVKKHKVPEHILEKFVAY